MKRYVLSFLLILSLSMLLCSTSFSANKSLTWAWEDPNPRGLVTKFRLGWGVVSGDYSTGYLDIPVASVVQGSGDPIPCEKRLTHQAPDNVNTTYYFAMKAINSNETVAELRESVWSEEVIYTFEFSTGIKAPLNLRIQLTEMSDGRIGVKVFVDNKQSTIVPIYTYGG